MVIYQKGFTLIEIMLVIAIIGILVAIAYPSYIEYVRKTNRVEAQAEMIEITKRLQRYKIANFTYQKLVGANLVPITLADLGHNGLLPEHGTTLYNLTLDFPASANGSRQAANARWVLVAEPVINTIQANNGVLCLNHRGERFWAQRQPAPAALPTSADCIEGLTIASNWDGR